MKISFVLQQNKLLSLDVKEVKMHVNQRVLKLSVFLQVASNSTMFHFSSIQTNK